MIRQAKIDLYRNVFDAIGKLRPCNVRDTIVLAGSPRSGTTWVLEILKNLSGYKALSEPLLRKQLRKYARDENNFYERTYIPPSRSAPEQRHYLHRALSGQVGSPRRWLFDAKSDVRKLIEHGYKNKLIVKFCRINRMLNWFDEQFQVRGIVLIIRHPCAVVNSMLKWEHGWNDVSAQDKNQEESPIYIKHLPESVQDTFAPVLDRISTPAEVLATTWCLDYYLPLMYSASQPWLLLPYERLVISGREELQRLANALEFEVTEDMIRHLYTPSLTARDRFEEDAEMQLSKWKHSLTTRQIDDILQVVEDVGLSTIYDDSVKPNFYRLNSLQKESCRWKI